MDSKKSNKIREIVRLQQILKKWKKLAANASSSKNAAINNYDKITSSSCNNLDVSGNTAAAPTSNNNGGSGGGSGGASKSMKFLKKTLSFTESSSSSSSSNDVNVPKGYLAVCVGKEEELKRFVIPTEYLSHQAFGILLREAEEEFGFQQQGVLRIPCQVAVFEKILKMMDQKSRHLDAVFLSHDDQFGFMNGADHDHDHHHQTHHDMSLGSCYSNNSPDNCELTPSRHAQVCR